MKFSRLRLSGFKSFVDATELHIEPGLTGVVGPNGCGKSNLLEAIRWVMGDTSPKSMRGTGMEDVIFAGTDTRQPRAHAEVALLMDNADRSAPTGFNDDDTLEISRRIKREAGSSYRVNGKETRARDVQTMFADASTGANSPALVRQGQIGQLINAKPKARRTFLEEAAGIGGLYSRRYEAELRLRAAETNLERLDDITAQLEQQVGSLRRQARQATRYKNLSGHIRRTEAILLHLRYRDAAEAVLKAESQLGEARTAVVEATTRASEAARAEATAEEALLPPRDGRAVVDAIVQRLKLEAESLDEKEREAQSRIEGLETQLREIVADLEREGALVADANQALANLDGEDAGIVLPAEGDEGETLANQSVTEATEKLQASETALDELTHALADLRARNQALERGAEEAKTRHARLTGQREGLLAEETGLVEAVQNTALAEDSAMVETARTALDNAVEDAEAADNERTRTHRLEVEAHDAAQESDRESGKLKAEAAALTNILGKDTSGLWPPVAEAISVDKGYERALATALGDDLDAPVDADAPRHWHSLGAGADSTELPSGCTPLSNVVNAPDVLSRRLRQVGIVETGDGGRLQIDLAPGQRLVDKAGALWRWDGFRVSADAPSAAAVRLEQKNRLADIEPQIEQATATLTELRQKANAACDAAKAAAEADTTKRALVRRAEEALRNTERAGAARERAVTEQNARLGALRETLTRIDADLEETAKTLEAAGQSLSGREDEGGLADRIAGARTGVEENRATLSEAHAVRDALKRDRLQMENRRAAIGRDRVAWNERADQAKTRIGALETRKTTMDKSLNDARNAPTDFEERRKILASKLIEAETRAAEAAEILTTSETTHDEAARAARAAEAIRAEAREVLARGEAVLEGANTQQGEVANRIHEAMECAPEEVLERGGVNPDEKMPPPADAESRAEKLKRERDNMGAVNLRAEEEMAELQQQMDALGSDRDDLIGAIQRLRSGIASLNKEGRKRMLAAFDEVNEHFQKLFTHLFGGGTAALELVESDDPLEAGLEIMAQPPGKKTKSMSLLSGGEQALTALSLIFAVFLTNPAPICVLDEVDAPLDDANVDRYCNLLDEMARLTDTRFLIITHHALTMSRMSRLFGVTMMEKGVSQLVSVDLEGAEQMTAA